MASISQNIDSSIWESGTTLDANVGDSLIIEGTKAGTTYIWAMPTDELTDVPGCSYTNWSSSLTFIKSKLIGTLTTAGTYKIRTVRMTQTSRALSKGAYITLNVIGPSQNYYSNLYYNANTGTGAPSDDKDTQYVGIKPSDRDVTISSTIPTLTNGVFKGWSKTQYTVGTGTVEYVAGNTISVPYLTTNTGITLYAVWGLKKKYYSKLSYNTVGGVPTVADDENIKEEETTPTARITTITSIEPTKTNYNFLGWSETKESETPEYKKGDNITVPYLDTDTGIVLFACYEKIKQIQPCFYVGDKKVVIKNINKTIIIK